MAFSTSPNDGKRQLKEVSRKYFEDELSESFLILVVAIVASKIQLLFLNSTEFTVNERLPEVRLYWMKQENQAIYNYSGP